MGFPHDRILGYIQPPADLGGRMALRPEFPQMTDRLLIPYHSWFPLRRCLLNTVIDCENGWQRLNRANCENPVDNPGLRQDTGIIAALVSSLA
jgi:hypothetical protein